MGVGGLELGARFEWEGTEHGTLGRDGKCSSSELSCFLFFSFPFDDFFCNREIGGIAVA